MNNNGNNSSRIRYGYPNDGKPPRHTVLRDLVMLNARSKNVYIVDYASELNKSGVRSSWYKAAKALGISINTRITIEGYVKIRIKK